MLLPVLSLDIRGPSVLCLSLYTSTTFIGKMLRLVFRLEEDESHMEQKCPLIATLDKPALSEASSLTTYA